MGERRRHLGLALGGPPGARSRPLRGLAASLDRGRAAVEPALELPWGTSPVEGPINRLKRIRRTMHGRAGLDLLRARILAA